MCLKDIYIIGDGGIGSNLSITLIKLLAFHCHKNQFQEIITLHIIDGDTVEHSNLIRQQFIPEDIGKKKVEITATYLQEISQQLGFTNINIIPHSFYLKKKTMDIIQEDAIVFVGVDNYITRLQLEQHSTKLNNVIMFFGGNEYDDGDVNIIWKKDGENMFPLLSEKHPEIKKKDKFPDEQSCEEALVHAPQLILANIIVANHMLMGFYEWITKESVSWHEIMFDINGNYSNRREICP